MRPAAGAAEVDLHVPGNEPLCHFCLSTHPQIPDFRSAAKNRGGAFCSGACTVLIFETGPSQFFA
jgi:hypothetical protein